MKQCFGFTVLVVLCLLAGIMVVQAQLRDLGLRDSGWRNRMVVGMPADDEVDDAGDDEGDDEGDDCLAYPAPVPKTGQTECWDEDGVLIACDGTYHDGDRQAGVAIEPRFADNLDGTVTDKLTGLIWLQDAGCYEEDENWETAAQMASDLEDGSHWANLCGLTDGSVRGDWRLPNVKELQSLSDFGRHEPALPGGHPFSGVQPSRSYWSSTSDVSYPDQAWRVHFGHDVVWSEDKADREYGVWPVRGGAFPSNSGDDEAGDDEGDDCAAYPAPVPSTGQSECWDGEGVPIACTGTGHDGDRQIGVAVEPRFTENGDGTVTDHLTGLIWLQNGDCLGEPDWSDAVGRARSLGEGSYWGNLCGLTDGSVYGDWRLPNIKEVHSLIDFGQHDPALPPGHPFTGLYVSYWSSTTNVNDPDRAWYVFFPRGHLHDNLKVDDEAHVLPVRGGP